MHCQISLRHETSAPPNGRWSDPGTTSESEEPRHKGDDLEDTAMPWDEHHHPHSWKNFTAPVRRKMIEIANALLEQGYEENRAIAIATAQGKEWAEHRDKQVRKDE